MKKSPYSGKTYIYVADSGTNSGVSYGDLSLTIPSVPAGMSGMCWEAWTCDNNSGGANFDASTNYVTNVKSYVVYGEGQRACYGGSGYMGYSCIRFENVISTANVVVRHYLNWRGNNYTMSWGYVVIGAN